MITKECYNELAKLNEIITRQNQKLRSENRDLKKKLEMLKDFEFLRMFFR